MKRFIALLLALIMTLSLCPVTALAQTTDSEAYEVMSHYVSEEDLGVTNEEAFAAYVQREIDKSLGYETPSFFRTSALEEGTVEKEIYDKLKLELGKIAAGERISTEITVYPIGTWSKEDLEVTSFVSDGNFTTETKVAIEGKLDLIVHCLLADCPLELYWYDKTVGTNMIYSGRESGGGLKLGYVTFSFTVATDYDDPTDTNRLTTDASITGATSTAIDKAKAIVNQYDDAADLEKLTAYKDEICALVTYNHEAADGMSTAGGINPWQMIYVFDGNAGTNVVCEGYAKAFQYLCDLSTFTGDIECHTVTGMMSGGTGAGGHMWNVVTMADSKNYLVDVTNCDTGTIGDAGSTDEPDKLFMAHTTNSANNNQTHTFTISGTNIVFTYDESMADLFCDGYLAISETAYGEAAQEYVPLYWTTYGGTTYYNSVETPIEQAKTGKGLGVWLYTKDGDTYTAIDSATFNNDTITKLNENIGDFGWSINGDGVEMCFWNTANAVEGTESGVVFTIGDVQYLVNLTVTVSTDEEAAANFAETRLYDYTTQAYYTAATFDNAWSLANGKEEFDGMSAERKAAVRGIVANVDDLLAAGRFIYWVLDGHKYNGQHFIEITDNTSDRDVAEFVGGYDLLWDDMTTSQKTMVNDALAAIGGQYTIDELYEMANERIKSQQARWFPAGTSGWEDRGPLTEAVAYANTLEEGTAYIELLSDVKTDAPLVFNEGTKTILDLNGYTIDRGLTEAVENGNVITVYGDLQLNDDSTTKQGKITGGYTADPVNYVGGGGGVNVFGTFTMTGGNITGNKGTTGGGVWSGGEFLMSGGEITGNTAMFGGGVKGNLVVHGSPVITGNVSNLNDPVQPNNVHLFSGETITVTGVLSADASIGVTTSTPPTIGVPVTVAMGTDEHELRAGDAEVFFSDAGYLTVRDVENNAVLLKDTTAAATLLGGPDVVATGEELTLTLHVAGTGICGVEAALDYDHAVWELVRVESLLEGWTFKQNEAKYLLYHEGESFDEADVLQVTLRVKSGFEDAETTVSFAEIEVSDGINDFETPDVTWEGQVKSTALDTTTGNLNLFDDSVLNGQLTCNYEIYDAKFADEDLDEVFAITVTEDGTFEVVPIAEKPEAMTWAAWGKEMAGTYKSAIMVRYDAADDCWSTTEKELTIKLTAVAPKVTAKAVKFNSFYEDYISPINLTTVDGVIGRITRSSGTELDWIKEDIRYGADGNGFYLELNSASEELNDGKASGKLNLEVWLEGYRAPAQVAVSVSAAYTAPKLKLSVSSVNVVSNAMYQNPVKLTLLSGDSKVAFADISVTSIRVATEAELEGKDATTYAASKYVVADPGENFGENGEFTLTTQNVDGVVAGGKVALIVTIGGNEKQTVIVPLTTKVAVPTLKATPAKLTVNRAMGEQEFTVEFTDAKGDGVDRFWFEDGNVTIESVLPKGVTDDDSKLKVVNNEDGTLTFTAEKGIDVGSYKVNVTAGPAKMITVNVTVNDKAPKLKLSKSSITLNAAKGDDKDTVDVILSSSDSSYSFSVLDEDLTTITVPEGITVERMANNTLRLSTAKDTPAGTYKVTIDHTIPDGNQISTTLTVKVVKTPPTVKLSSSSISLDKVRGIATIDVMGLDGFDLAGDEYVDKYLNYTVTCGKETPGNAVSIEENENKDLVVMLGAGAVPGKSYKVSIVYKLAATEKDENVKTKAVTLTVKAVDTVTGSVSVKGNMDITRPGTTSSNFTFKYTGWCPGEYGEVGPTLMWEVYAMNGKKEIVGYEGYDFVTGKGSLVASSNDNNSGWFWDVDDTDYGVSLVLNTDEVGAWKNGEVNPKYTYNVYVKLVFADDSEVACKPVKMTVKQSSAKFAANVKAVDLYKADDDSSAEFTISGTDKDAMNVADIDRVELVSSALVEQLAFDYQVDDDKTCKCTLMWNDDADRAAAKSGTVKLNIWLVGNQNNTKPNATVSVKVNVK